MSPEKPEKTKERLAERILRNRKKLREWYVENSKLAPPPFYSSVDLRDAGYKITPVDNNIYPAGFNNICPEDLRAAPVVLRANLEDLAQSLGKPFPRKILILPESHTQNLYYLENLHYLDQIVREAGCETRIGWYGKLPEGVTEPFTLKSATGKELRFFPIELDPGKGPLSAGGFTPDLVILNNDFSSGYPGALDNVTQPIFPSHTLGWHSRKKSDHFVHYNALAREFASIIDIDPWMIEVETEEVNHVNFNEDQGIDRAAEAVDRVLEKIRGAYSERKISQKPFVFVKNNQGTYGMGIMVARSGDELRNMNRRAKNKMSVGKNRSAIESVVVQEGVPTATLVDRLPAEPVIYLFGSQLIGGFLRTNTEKTTEENLNSPGMVFRKLCMSDLRADAVESTDESDLEEGEEKEPVLELVYGAIARISALATGREMVKIGRGQGRS